MEQQFKVHVHHERIRRGEAEGLVFRCQIHALREAGIPAAHRIQEHTAGYRLCSSRGDLHRVVAVGSQRQGVAAETADQLVVPVDGAARNISDKPVATIEWE